MTLGAAFPASISTFIFEEFLLKMGTHIRCIYGFYNHIVVKIGFHLCLRAAIM